MDVELLFPSKWLSATDLKGKEVTVTIESFTVEDLQTTGSKTERKGVMRFVGKEKALVFSAKIHKRVMVHLFGSETDDWAGKRIVLYPTRDNWKGRPVQCIRIRTDADRPAAMKDFVCNNRHYTKDHEEWLKSLK